jgi:hypothetical protein
MNRFILSRASPEALKLLGYRLLIAGLIGEAVVILSVPSGIWEKLLNAFFTLMIAVGVWFEQVGADAPRRLTPEQQKRIAMTMSPFKGLRAVLGAVPPSAKNTDLLNQILCALKTADVDAFINLTGVEASVSPTGQSNRGTMLTEGFPNGVTMQFVTGNDRGEAFSKALAKALNGEHVTASAVGGRDEMTMEWRLKQGGANGLTRNDKQFEVVVVVVGDKP